VTTLDGRIVLVSENVGPALVGVWRPQVVVPAWSLELRPAERRLMLLHEDEHVRAHDPWLRAAGAALLVLAPWNPALWWQLRRLRLAVEMDCGARVLARGPRVTHRPPWNRRKDRIRRVAHISNASRTSTTRRCSRTRSEAPPSRSCSMPGIA